MKGGPPPHENHFHFSRQRATRNYIVYDCVMNRDGDTFRMWIPKGILVDDDIKNFPAFCERQRYRKPRSRPEPKARRKRARSRN